ncbi:MAG: ATP-binding domain-containing protein, partial [Methylococcales bacterium]|nr:ATP-binding domain-containing protein [Methylococcales bacterium]
TDNLDDTANTVTMLTLHAAKGLEFPIVFLTGLEDGVLPHSRSLDDAEELAEERRLFYVGLTRAKDRLFISDAFRRTFFGESSVAVPSRFLRDIPATLTEGGTMTKRREQSKTRASRWSSGGTGASSKTRWSSSSSSSSTKRRASSSGRQTSKRGKRPSRTQHQTPPKTSNRQPKPKLRVTPRHLQEEFEPEITETPKQTAPQYQSGQRIRHAKFGEGTVIECKSVGNDQEVTVAFPDIGIKRLAASFAELEILD